MTPRGKKAVVLASVLSACLLTFGAAAGVTHAWHRHGGPFGGFGFGGRLMGALSDLDLTDDQKTRIKAILGEEGPKIEPLLDQVAQSKKTLFEAIHGRQFDEGAVRSASAAAAGAQTELAVERARTMSRLRALLTPDQQARLETIRQELEQQLEKRIGLARSIWREHAADFVDAL